MKQGFPSPEVFNAVLKRLKQMYHQRGNNDFVFRSKNLDLPHSTIIVGHALAKLAESTEFIEKINDSKTPYKWRTRFNQVKVTTVK